MKNKNRRRAGLFLVIAAVLFTNFATSGRFDRIRPVDAVSLIAIGMMIGVAIVNMVSVLRSS
jgi:hypothetical protein